MCMCDGGVMLLHIFPVIISFKIQIVSNANTPFSVYARIACSTHLT